MFNERLKQKRLEKGLTQAELARRIGISRDLYNKYERTETRPSHETLSLLSKELDTTIDFLISNVTDSSLLDNNKKELSAEEQQTAKELYYKLVEVGFIKKGEKFTDRHLDVLFEVIAPQIEFARFKLNNSK